MQLKNKKQIAKEFLLFVGVIAVSLLIYGGTHLYNGVFYWKAQYYEHKAEEKSEKLKRLTASFRKEANQKWLFNLVKSELSAEPLTKIKVKRFMANGNQIQLPEDKKQELATIIRGMEKDGYSEDKIKSVVSTYKNKHGKKKEPTSQPSDQPQKIDTYQEFWQIFEDLAKKDTIVHKWNNKWSGRFKAILEEKGITNGKAFSNFIKANTLTEQDRQNKELAGKVRKEKDYHENQERNSYESQLNSKEQWNFLVYPFYGLLIMAYPVRYFVLAVWWSILTLRKEE